MLSLRYIFRLVSAFIARFRLIILASLVIGALSFVLISFLGPKIWGTNVERIGITGRFHIETLPPEILELIGDGLTQIDEGGLVNPNLAESWDSPDKGKTWIFHLKPGTLWQDGKKVDSESIKYEFTDVRVEKPDDKTVVFFLQNEFSPFASVVSKPIFKRGLLGTGEWRVESISVSQDIIQKIVIKSASKDTKIYRFYPTEDRAKLAYKLGEIDILRGVYNPNPFLGWANTQVKELIDEEKEVVLFFNTEDKFLSDKNLRQAISYAIDKEALPGKRAISPLSPNSWAYNPQVKRYNYDPDRAKELLDEMSEESKKDLKINIVSSPILLDVAEKIASDIRNVGVEAIVQVSAGIPSEYQTLLAIYDTPKDPDQYSIWHSTQVGSNVSKYKDPRIDKLLENGRKELSLEERRTIYLDFQRFLLEDSPAVFLYHPKTFEVTRN